MFKPKVHRVLILSYGLGGRGGTETVLRNTWKNFQKHGGVECKIFIIGKVDHPKILEGMDYQVISTYERENVKPILVKELRSKSYQSIMCMKPHHIIYALDALSATRLWFRPRTKVYFSSHTPLDLTKVEEGVVEIPKEYPIAVNKIDKALALSSGMKKELMDIYKVPDDKIEIVYNPIIRQNRVIPKSSSNVPQFIYMGRFENWSKKITDLIDAFDLINRPYHLRLIGSGIHKEMLEKHLTEKRSSTQEKISFDQDWSYDPWSTVSCANALVLSSRFEGFGLVLAEALSYGIPCISSNCEVGPSDIIQHGINGYLYETGNIEELKERVLDVMDNKIQSDAEVIKRSIEPMYEDNYYQRLYKIMGIPKKNLAN